jgi:hypothetical protein
MIINEQIMSVEQDATKAMAHTILYEVWYSIAETLFQRTIQVVDLDPEQVEALRRVMLRPNDFQIHMDGEPL